MIAAMHNFATFIVSALVTLGVGGFVLLCALGLWRHFSWSRRMRRRIGRYT